MRNKIIILDGADKVGKSACIDNIVSICKSEGIDYLTMFHKNTASTTSDRSTWPPSTDYEQFFRDNKSIYDINAGNLQFMDFWIAKWFMSRPPGSVIIFDRLHLSSLVFGKVLRPESFLRIWGTYENYIRFMNIFESCIQQYAEVQLFVLYNNEFILSEDTENTIVKMSIDSLVDTNEEFLTAFAESTILDKTLVYCNVDDRGWYNSWEQIKNELNL